MVAAIGYAPVMSDALATSDSADPTLGTAVAAAPSSRRAQVDTMREALDEARVVMLTSVAPDGLHSRPLTLLNVDQEGGLWFLVDADEWWVPLLIDEPNVDVSADLHGDGKWVSVSGVAVLTDDRAVIAELWTPAASAFWESKDDPTIRVLRVDPSIVDVWRSAPSAVGRLFAIGKAIVTGESDDVGSHDHLVIAAP